MRERVVFAFLIRERFSMELVSSFGAEMTGSQSAVDLNQLLEFQKISERSTFMQPFDFSLNTRIVFGNDSIDRLGELTSEIGASRVLIVSDPGVVEAGHCQHGLDSLKQAGLTTLVFDGARENPTTEQVDQGVAVAKEFQPDAIVGLGGGSSMDCAKGINFIYSNGGVMQDYWGVGKAKKPMLPMIAVPTTAGTGSELQSFALISDADTHAKMACGDKKATCRVAILDPLLTLTQPSSVTALTGIDALSHALETYVTTRRNPMSLNCSRESWRLIATSFRRVLEAPDDVEARARMQLGASFAGLAIENSMLGASHALANPLTANFGTAHGQAVGAMLPHVIRFNGTMMAKEYRDLLAVTAHVEGMPAVESGVEGLAEFVASLLEAAGLHVRLREMGVDKARFDVLAQQAAKQWTGEFNPRPVDETKLREMYELAF